MFGYTSLSDIPWGRWIIALLFLFFGLIVLFTYHPNRPLEELKSEYTYEDSRFKEITIVSLTPVLWITFSGSQNYLNGFFLFL